MIVVLPFVRRCFLLLLLALSMACSREGGAPPALRDVAPVPANPGLSEKGRALLQRLSENYGTSTVAGQVDYREGGRYRAVEYINKVAERSPVIVGLDLMDYSPSRVEQGADPGNLIADALDMAKKGHVLTLSWHWNAPMRLINDHREPWWRGFYTSATEFNLRYALANRNSAEFQALLRDIDAIGTQLKILAEADVPVLWRPLHAADGRWFWWGAKGPEPFKELWRLMFVRFTDQFQLNNLLWVYTGEDPDWYPGDDVVDVVGVDAYPDDQNSTLLEYWSAMLQKHNGRKMIALTEFGGVPSVDEMHAARVWFSYFVSWTDQNRGKLGPMSVPQEHLRKVYQSPGVISWDEWHGTPIWHESRNNDPATGGAQPPVAPVSESIPTEETQRNP